MLDIKQAFNTPYLIQLQLSFHHMKFYPPWVISWGVWVLKKLLRAGVCCFQMLGGFFPFYFFPSLLIAYENLFVILHKVFNFPSSSGHVQNRTQDLQVLHTDKPIKTKVGCSQLAKRDQIQQTEGVKFRNCDQYWGLCLSLTANSILKGNFWLFSLKSPLQVKLMFRRVITKGELLRQLSFHWSLSAALSLCLCIDHQLLQCESGRKCCSSWAYC